jgi:hypothetical protein
MFQLENEAMYYEGVPEIRCRRCGVVVKAKAGVNNSVYRTYKGV